MCDPLGQWNEPGTLIDTLCGPSQEIKGGHVPREPRMPFSKERELDSRADKMPPMSTLSGAVSTPVRDIESAQKITTVTTVSVLVKAPGSRRLLTRLVFQELSPRTRWFSNGCIWAQWPTASTRWTKCKVTYLVFTLR